MFKRDFAAVFAAHFKLRYTESWQRAWLFFPANGPIRTTIIGRIKLFEWLQAW